jgi:hypothetical protein
MLQYSLYPEAMVSQMVAEVRQAVLQAVLHGFAAVGVTATKLRGMAFTETASSPPWPLPPLPLTPTCLPARLPHLTAGPARHPARRSAAH